MADDAIGPEPMRTDPDYKMGIGQRILGIANNFLQGMAHHPAVTNTGRGAINEGKYGVAHSKWLDQARRATAGSGGQEKAEQNPQQQQPVSGGNPTDMPNRNNINFRT